MKVLKGRRILVLEEEAGIARLLVQMLDALNCEVIGPADRVPEALDLLLEHDVDAAIVDVKIEGQPSYPLAEELIRRGIPWAFASANSADDFLRRYPGVPAIAKPYASAHIQAVLERLLGSARHGAETFREP